MLYSYFRSSCSWRVRAGEPVTAHASVAAVVVVRAGYGEHACISALVYSVACPTSKKGGAEHVHTQLSGLLGTFANKNSLILKICFIPVIRQFPYSTFVEHNSWF